MSIKQGPQSIEHRGIETLQKAEQVEVYQEVRVERKGRELYVRG